MSEMDDEEFRQHMVEADLVHDRLVGLFQELKASPASVLMAMATAIGAGVASISPDDWQTGLQYLVGVASNTAVAKLTEETKPAIVKFEDGKFTIN